MKKMILAEMLFNQPLMVTEHKLNTILHVMGPRLNLDLDGMPQVSAEVVTDRERMRAGYTVSRDGTAVIGVYGPLIHRRLASEFPSGGPTTYGEIRKAFDTALKDDSVKSIILDVDSPGGQVSGVFDLADHIYTSRKTKSIVAVVNEDAFSAAYLLASAASKIYVPRTGEVGSVGTIATHADFSRMEDEAGITVTHVFAGARKADFSPHQPLSQEALNILQESVNESYELFVTTVARNRGMKVKDVKATEAGIFEGQKGVDIGFADAVMPIDQAIAHAGKTHSRTMITASTDHKNRKESKMTIEELREEYPDQVSQIEEEARAGMVAESDVRARIDEAVTEASAGSDVDAVMSLHEAVMPEAVHTQFADMVTANVTAAQAKSLGAKIGAEGGSSSEKILAGLKDSALQPAGTAKEVSSEDTERSESAKRLAEKANAHMKR